MTTYRRHLAGAVLIPAAGATFNTGNNWPTVKLPSVIPLHVLLHVMSRAILTRCSQIPVQYRQRPSLSLQYLLVPSGDLES